MRAAELMTCLWPGLPRLWLRGDRAALLKALGFAALLNVALVVCFVWPKLLNAWSAAAIWLVLGGGWLLTAWRSYRKIPTLCSFQKGMNSDDDLFPQAQIEYLKGNWLAAETLLNSILESEPDDTHARLTLAALYRRTRQTKQSRRQLELLTSSKESQKMKMEIQHESRLLDRLENEIDRNSEGEFDNKADVANSRLNTSTAA